MESLNSKKYIVLAAFLSLALPNQFASAQAPVQIQPASIDKNGILILVRSTLHALDLSNKSGNYTILREISAPGFAATNDAARLSQIFKNLRDKGVDLSGTLIYEPQITSRPEIDKSGMMRFAGFFPSASNQIKFQMIFAPVNGQWKLFGLAADMSPVGPIAPMPTNTQPQANNQSSEKPSIIAPQKNNKVK